MLAWEFIHESMDCMDGWVAVWVGPVPAAVCMHHVGGGTSPLVRGGELIKSQQQCTGIIVGRGRSSGERLWVRVPAAMYMHHVGRG